MTILYFIELLGIFSFAVSGAFAGMENKLDPFGVLVVSFMTAIGGGTLRDIMIGNLPVMWLTDNVVITLIFCSAIITMLFGHLLKHLTRTLFIFDALGVGLFTIYGVEIAMRADFGMGVCIAIGTITAVFGGVLRDVVLNKVPLVFRKEIYALAAIAGGLLYFGLKTIDLNPDIARIICALFIFIIRVIVVKYNVSLPAWYHKN